MKRSLNGVFDSEEECDYYVSFGNEGKNIFIRTKPLTKNEINRYSLKNAKLFQTRTSKGKTILHYRIDLRNIIVLCRNYKVGINPSDLHYIKNTLEYYKIITN